MRSAAEPRRIFWGSALGLLAADIVTKRIAESTLLPIPPVQVLGEWLQLRLVYNQGAAFGLHLGEWSRWIFLAVALIAVVLLYRMARSSSPSTCCARWPAAWWREARPAICWTGSGAPRAWWISSTWASARPAGRPSTWPTWG